jgi:hypothetical protein
MKANELRIGNYVYELLVKDNCFVNTEIQLHTVGEYVISSVEKGRAMPIPLTEEWLIKFGFESVGLGGNRFVLYNAIDGTSNFVIETDGIILYPQIDYDIVCWSEFKYVHQLQNLYFALTGEELILSE